MNKFGLPQITLDELLSYFSSKPEIEKVLIFGSRAKECFHNGSDIDFAIWTTDNENFYKIHGELDDLPTPYKFDVINYNTLEHVGMRNSINKDGVLFYKKVK